MDPNVVNKRLQQTFSWNHCRETFFKTVFDLRNQELFCDVTLCCEGVMFPAHRLVLSMCSEFFLHTLTKAPPHHHVILVVPGVSAQDLNAILKYIYQGEMQVTSASLRSLLKAAHTLKIKGLMADESEGEADDATPTPPTTTTAATTSAAAATATTAATEDESSQESFADKKRKKRSSKQRSKKRKSNNSFPKVEVFIDDDDDDDDDDGGGDGGDGDDICFDYDDEINYDPLNVPLLSPAPLTFDNPSSPPTPTLPLEVTLKTENDTTTPTPTNNNNNNNNDNTTTTAATYHTTSTPATLSSLSTFGTYSTSRYTREQKLEIVQEYYLQGPVKTARLMSQRLGRRMNESSVRSIVRSWEKHNKEYNLNNSGASTPTTAAAISAAAATAMPGRIIYDEERKLQAFY